MQKSENEFSFYNLFIPLTTKKAFLFIAIIGIVVFFNGLFGKFVWDDVTYIGLSRYIHEFNIVKLFAYNEFNSGGYYRPIPAVYFSALWNLFGIQTFYYHFVQVVLHIVDTCLLFLLFKKFLNKYISFFLSLIFLIHPVQVESVVYIGAAQSELLFIFGISALLLVTSSMKNIWYKIAFSLLLLLSLFTKETGFLFFIMASIYLLFFKKKSFIKMLPFIISPFFIYFPIRFWYAKVFFVKNISSPIGLLSLHQRFINIPEIIFYYIKVIFLPINIGVDQRWTVTQISFNTFYFPLMLGLIFIGLILFVGFSVKNFRNTYIFFVLWLFLGMGMLLQIFPLDMTVADRWMYFPIVGFLGIVGILIESNNFIQKNIKIFIYAGVILIVILSVRTIIRNADWVDSITLYSHDVKVDDNYDLEDNLGTDLAAMGYFKEALPHFLKGYKDSPHATNIYDLGLIYDKLGNYKLAEKYYYEVLTIKDIPKESDSVVVNTYNGLSKILLLHESPEVSKALLIKAVKRYPNNGTYWAYLALSEYSLGNKKEALYAALKAKDLLPNPTTLKLYSRIHDDLPIDIK
ncbi:MAG TPA: tetratricopeptide repeat protein [Patescibacteria group bacterium]